MIVLAIVNLPALWTGDFYTQDLTRDETLPQYWTDAIAALDAQSARHARARDPGLRLRRLPVGPDRRPDHARAHGPSVRRARAGAVGLGGVGRPAQRARPPASRRARSTRRRARADRAPDGERRDRLPRRPPDRPLRPGALDPAVGLPHRARARPASATVEKFGTSLGPPLHEQIDDELQLALPADATDPPPVSIFQVDDTRVDRAHAPTRRRR